MIGYSAAQSQRLAQEKKKTDITFQRTGCAE
jgi:hypothetical protein